MVLNEPDLGKMRSNGRITRSNSGKELETENSSSSDGTTRTPTSGETDATTTSTGATTINTDVTEATPGTSNAGEPVGTSGIRATPAASTDTVVERRPSLLMPPPANATVLKPARSHRSKASSKRLLAELEAKERLAELEIRRISAEAALMRIQQERRDAASSSDDSDDERENLAPKRVAEWLEQRPEEAAIEVPPRSARDVDVSSLTAALTEAIQAGRTNKRFLSELPVFNGLCTEWLQFKAAYNESSPSFSSSENVARIRRSLKGVAWEAVSALLISQPRPEDLLNALERRYGRPDALLLSEIEKMKGLPRLTENPRDLCIFASRIANTVATIEILKKPQYLYNPEVLRLIVEKLTPILRNKWYDYAVNKEDTPELKKIAEFLNQEADKCAPYAPPEQAAERQESKTARKKPEHAYAAAATTEQRKEEKPECPLCKHSSHQLPSCPTYKKLDTNERWEVAKKHNICYRCLASTHRRFACRSKPCGHQGCPMKHHRLLHHERPPTAAATSGDQPPSKQEEVVASAVKQVAGAATRANRAYLKIAPVTLRGPQAEIDAFALLDEGSTVTIIDATLADSLGLDGPTEPMWVQGVGGNEMAHKKSKKVNLHIKNRHGGNEERIFNAHTVGSLDFTTQSVGETEVENCAHLEEIKHELIYEDATPKILIGQDNWELIVSHEIRKGRRDQLVASKTALGWVLHGCRTSHAEPIAYCCAHLTRAEPTSDIEEQMKKYFALESLSIEPRKQTSDPELQALKLLDEKSRRLPDGRFETGLLWRNDQEDIPNNRACALKRLHTLERKLDRDEKLKEQYKERVANLLSSSYAELATTPPTRRTWYLPHFAVCNPEKPKIRLVHDAAATSHGRSLNDMLLPGPDFLQSLPGVIMRFRQHRVAVSADLKEMFMQIKIRNEDRDALRFLWRGDRREGEPEEYRMTSVIFGASSSPCTALYVKNRNAREHATQFPEAAAAIERNHYMDDYLQSFPALNEARRITSNVDFVHKQAGFQLRGWATNTSEAISDVIGSEEREGITVPIGGSELEKTLGLLWNTTEDSIRFRLNTRRAPPEVIDDLRPPTKREALSIIMSIFDPLGLISPMTTPAKRIMQDAWRYQTGWDEKIPDELHARWSEWLLQLRDLGALKIPRCYEASPGTRYELHTMVDASEEAYAAAVYWRITRADGSIKIALAAGKSRVTPTKIVSIPKLELQSAVLGVRLAKAVAEEHDFEIAARVYWSDSRTALTWIRGEPRTYKTFVAHRLAEIEDATKKNEWRWVPSAHNAADDATRATPADFDASHRWFNGPSFLYLPESTWPVETKIEVPVTSEEREKCGATRHRHEKPASIPIQIERFSKWTRLLRAAARVLQFIALCRSKTRVPAQPGAQTVAAAHRKRTLANKKTDENWGERPQRATTCAKPHAARAARAARAETKYITLEAKYLLMAKQLLMRASQEDSYERERDRVLHERAPDKEDRLAKLSVFLDDVGLLRLRGRIAEADDLREDTVRPIVLCGRHLYTQLYIQHVHEQLHHGGTEIVVNELRQRVHIATIRPAVKRIIAKCPKCQLRKARPAAPSTGDLPAARLAHHTRPFTHTGWDYYGPQEVTVGRHREKRWIALFTCMTSRAIHLETVTSLSADSAINALRRFIARRGCPTELWSDNATAFRGADRELTEAIQGAADARHIRWRFLPPAAPFMAGAWERMVRTVKTAMRATLLERCPSDETLSTLLAEAEATVNSRPLTYVPVTPDDPPALTPNMILLGPDCYSPAPGTFVESDDNARQHWRRAQRLADNFWRRWVREYTPVLQHRREPHNQGACPAVGDVVIVCDSNLPRNTWPRGRVTQTYPGKDGVVRVVDVATNRGHILRRPTKKIVVLPVGSLSDDGRMFTTRA